MSTPAPDPAPLRSAPPCAAPAQAQWFADEVQPHGAQLKAWIRGTFPDIRNDVEDVVQETFLRTWKRQAAKPIASVKAFLFRSAKNAAIDLLRHHRRTPIDSSRSLESTDVLDERPTASEALTAEELSDLLADALATLPPRSYEIIVLHRFKGLPQKEVAERLGLSVRTVEWHVREAVKRCETFLHARGVTSL